MTDVGLNDVKTGDILYTAWGYDCTMIEFYQVVRTTKKSFWIKKIVGDYEPAHDSSMFNEIATPCKNEFEADMEFGTKARRKLKQTYVWLDNNDHSRGTLEKWNKGMKLIDDRMQY